MGQGAEGGMRFGGPPLPSDSDDHHHGMHDKSHEEFHDEDGIGFQMGFSLQGGLLSPGRMSSPGGFASSRGGLSHEGYTPQGGLSHGVFSDNIAQLTNTHTGGSTLNSSLWFLGGMGGGKQSPG